MFIFELLYNKTGLKEGGGGDENPKPVGRIIKNHRAEASDHRSE